MDKLPQTIASQLNLFLTNLEESAVDVLTSANRYFLVFTDKDVKPIILFQNTCFFNSRKPV